MEEVLTSLITILEYECANCYIPNGDGCFPKCINCMFKKDFCMEFFEFFQLYKRRTNVMTRCRFAEICERYKRDIGIYDPKSKRILAKNVKRRDIYVHIHKKHYRFIWKKKTR